MLDQQDGDAPRTQRRDQLHHPAGLLRVHPGEGLVEQHHVGLGGKRHRHAERPLRAVGQLRGERVPIRRQSEEGEELLHPLPILRRAPRPALPQRGEEVAAVLEMAPHQDVVAHPHLEEEGGVLEGAHQPLRRHPVHGESGQVPCPVDDTPRGGGEEAADDVERGGLARAVRADEPADLAPVDGKIQAVDGNETAEALHQPLHAEDFLFAFVKARCGRHCASIRGNRGGVRRERTREGGDAGARAAGRRSPVPGAGT